MVLVHVRAAFRRQNVEGRNPVIVERGDGPAIAAVSIGIFERGGLPGLHTGEQIRDAAFPLRCLTQCGDSIGKSGPCGGARRCILLADQPLRFCGPRHDLGIEQRPAGLKAVPEIHRIHCSADARQDGFAHVSIEKVPASAGENRACLTGHHAETLPCNFGVAADSKHSTRSHMLLFRDIRNHRSLIVLSDGG